MNFITEQDFDMQIKQEIKNLLDSSEDGHALKRATDTAISQVKKYLGGSFDMSQIFIESPGQGEEDIRDQFIVTIVIDLLLYHLYSKCPMSQLPQHRSLRYQDAINWLRDVGLGEIKSDLPKIENEYGDIQCDVKIWSRPPSNHKY